MIAGTHNWWAEQSHIISTGNAWQLFSSLEPTLCNRRLNAYNYNYEFVLADV